MNRFLLVLGLLSLMATPGLKAHDPWVQINTNLVRTGDVIHIDLMLGNHGNEHRDFKLASKIGLEGVQSIGVFGPNGGRKAPPHDLKPDLVDLGLSPKDGFHSARYVPVKPGLYEVFQTMDRIVHHGKPVHAIKTAKAYFGVSDSLDHPAIHFQGFDKPIGQGLELVFLTNPVFPVGPGTSITVQLFHKGKPLPETKVSFIPRGTTLKENLDAEYERFTDNEGKASFAPKLGTFHLIVAHLETAEKGDGFESTTYNAAATLYIPQKRPVPSIDSLLPTRTRPRGDRRVFEFR